MHVYILEKNMFCLYIKYIHTVLYIYIYIYIYTPLQKYWNSEANSFIFAVDWKHLGLT